MLGRRTGIELHHAGQIRDRFHAGERENHADELDPERFETFVPRLQILGGQVRRADCN